MVSLKKFLDQLAGPDHPFVKGPVENLGPTTQTDEPAMTEKAKLETDVNLNKFLRVNTN